VLRRLDRLRNEHWLGRYRAFAVAGLVRLIEQTDDPELSRKAAVDLLKADLATTVTDPPAGRGRAQDEDAEATDGGRADAEAVLEALRQIGVDEQTDGADPAARADDGARDARSPEAGP